MRILGVDPGTLLAGYGCLDLQGVDSGSSGSSGPGLGTADAGTLPIAHRVSNLARFDRARIALVSAGVWRLGSSADPIVRRLCRLADELRRLIAESRPDELALEEAYFGKSVQSALRVGEARGVILAEAGRAGLPVRQFPPARVKRSVAGSGAASKDQVARMVQRSLGLPAPPETRDVSDALAVALCCAEARRSFRWRPA